MLPSERPLETARLVYPEHEDIDLDELTTKRRRFPHTLLVLCVVLSCLMIVIAGGVAISFIRPHGTHPNSACGNPSARREWRTLSEKEKHDYIDAVLCLKNVPSRLGMNQSLYDDFPWIHTMVGGYSAHDTAGFLAWHRYFLHVYEKALREQCGFRGYLTYWDWTLDWEDVNGSPVWDYKDGFGGNGNASIKNPLLDGYCLTEGPFSRLEVPYIGPDYKPHCLSRGLQPGEKLAELGQSLRPEALRRVLSLPDYESFNLGLEEGPHLSVPKIIRGDFQLFTAPNDPIFFLHHTQLDRLWWIWQLIDPKKRQAEYLGKASNNSTAMASITDVLPMGGLATGIKVLEILSTQGGFLCYRY